MYGERSGEGQEKVSHAYGEMEKGRMKQQLAIRKTDPYTHILRV